MYFFEVFDVLKNVSIFLIAYLLLVCAMFLFKYFRQEKKTSVKKYTFEFCQSDKNNYDLILSQKDVVLDMNETNKKIFLESNIFQILHFFDNIAIGVKNGLLDESIINDYYFRYFYLFYKTTKYGELLNYRNIENDPFVFIEYEKLLNKWLNQKQEKTYDR
jgi:hypothetical protein